MYVFTDSTLKHLLKKIKSKIALKSELDNKVDKVDEIELFSFEPKGIEETIIPITKKIYSIEDLKIFYSPLNTSYTFEDLYYIEGGEDYLPSYNLMFDTYYGGVYLYIDILGDNYYRFTIDYHEYLRENTVINFTLEKEKGLSDNDFTDSAKSLLEAKFTSVEASYSTGMTHIEFSNENESNTKTIDLKTDCDMFFYPSIGAELLSDLNGNVTIPYAFISKSGSDIGKVTVNIKSLTNNTSSENVFNVTDNGSELILEGASSGNANISFTIEGNTKELKANVLGEYSTVIMLPLTVYRSTDSSLVPSNVSNTKTIVSDYGNGEYEIMLYSTADTNYFNFSNVQTLTNVSYISDSVTNMFWTYYECYNLTGSPVCGPNVTDMSSTYRDCYNLTGSPVCGDNVISMGFTYWNCYNLTGSPVCGPNVTSMSGTYENCYNLTGSPVCGNNVTSMSDTYANCYNLTGSPVCGPNVTDMWYAYANCRNLTGSPVCGPNVVSMPSTYRNCYNLTGSPVCGDKATDLIYTYANCRNLTGSPVCGPNVTSMNSAYYGCIGLTGSPVCGNKVTSMCSTYRDCANLTGAPVCGPNVINMHRTYNNCTKLYGDFYVRSNDVSNAVDCFFNRNNSHQLNIIVNFNTTSHSTFKTNKITYLNLNWTDAGNGSIYCWNDTANIVIFNALTTSMNDAFSYDEAITKAACGPNVTNMSWTYFYCSNLTGSPVCGNKVTNMAKAYAGCNKLTGSPVCGPNVTNMYMTYYYCNNLTGSPACGNNVTNMQHAYAHCNNITGNPACGPNVTDMASAYSGCINLTGNPVCGSDVKDMSNTYQNCQNLTGSPVCGNNVTNMYGAYNNCQNLTGSPVCGSKVTSMDSVYYNCKNLTGSPVCGAKVKSMYETYSYCTNLTGSPVCGNLVTNMYYTYYGCTNLTGNSVCGPNVTNMSFAYCGCHNITSAACGKKVTNMSSAYAHCSNLTGAPVCGDNVIEMNQVYFQCSNLTGPPVCGPNVTNMYWAYGYCYNITGPAICGNKVTNISAAYEKCGKLASNAYFYSNRINNAQGCFKDRNTQKRLNLYVPSIGYNSTYNTLASCLKTFGSNSLVANSISWTDNTGVNGYYYNTAYNIYIYPISNMAQTYKENELLVARYIMSSGANVIPQKKIDIYGTIEFEQTAVWDMYYSDIDLYYNEEELIVEGAKFHSTGNNGYNYYYTYDDISKPLEELTSYFAIVLLDRNTKQIEFMGAQGTDTSVVYKIKYKTGTEMQALELAMEDITNDDGTITREILLDKTQAGNWPSSISFNGATNLLTVEKLKIDNITDTSHMFNGCSNLISVCAMDWDTSKITKADYMFTGCSKLTKESFTEDVIYNIPMHVTNEDDLDTLPLNSIDDFVKVVYVSQSFTLEDFQKNADYYERRLGTSGILRIDSTGHIKLEATDEPGVDVTVTVYYKNGDKISFELPAVESASHIFDGCTNLL